MNAAEVGRADQALLRDESSCPDIRLSGLYPDYLTLGHPTLDIAPNGGLFAGGSVLYSGLQAARLEQKSVIIGRANIDSINPFWSKYSHEAEMVLQDSDTTTTFRNVEVQGERHQLVDAWAGHMKFPYGFPSCKILHIAPVANELDLTEVMSHASADFICLTAQGLIRRWTKSGSVKLVDYEASKDVYQMIDIVVVADYEAPYADKLLRGVVRTGGLAVITRGQRGCQVTSAGGTNDYPADVQLPVVDSTGAGDIFASTIFIELYRETNIVEAIQLASTAAATSLRGFGLDAISMRTKIPGNA